eukprot:2438027-Pleurochrysis_carterae.AAC.1
MPAVPTRGAEVGGATGGTPAGRRRTWERGAPCAALPSGLNRRLHGRGVDGRGRATGRAGTRRH